MTTHLRLDVTDDDNLFPGLAEPVSMPTAEPASREEEGYNMSQGVKLEEKLWIDECYLFQDESLAPIFCKSKLIPLKTITTQKLEQMQREQMEKLQVPEKEPNESTIHEEPEDVEDHEASTKEADVWTADD
uniref:Uncharacterized protein n=1 Tax=Caenorhabditis japonica TaxID=281687 RepID=A0A8R1HIW8_CAEJA